MENPRENRSPDEPVTGEELTRRWNLIRSRLAEEVRPRALRSALRNPWVIGAGAAVAGLGVGFVLARRQAARALPDCDESQAAAHGEPDAATSSRGEGLNPVYRRLLEMGIDALAKGVRKSIRE